MATAATRARLIRAAGSVRRRWPRVAAGLRRHASAASWRRLRAVGPPRMDPVNLWLVLLLVAITLASGLATLAQAFHLV
jgi:hypothetical protein